MLVANLTRAVIEGVNVRVIGIRLGLQTASRMTSTGTRTGKNLIPLCSIDQATKKLLKIVEVGAGDFVEHVRAGDFSI